MTIQLDHLILPVNDCGASLDFYTGVLGFTDEGERAPFTVVRVSADLVLQLAPWGTTGGTHLAFAMPREEFARVFQRVRDTGIAYGDAFDTVGNMRGPGEAPGAHGPGKGVHVFDPKQHLIEIRDDA